MGTIIALGALGYGGWKGWPWYAPILALGLLLPFTLFGVITANRWMAEAGIRGRDAIDVGIGLLLNLLLLYVAFGLGRLVRRFRSKKKLAADARFQRNAPA